MIIDSHAHLNFKSFDKDRGKVIEKCLKEDVWVLNVGSKLETSRKAVEIAKEYSEGVYAAVGLHPIHAVPGLIKIKTDPEEGSFETSGEDFNIEEYRSLALSNKSLAVGEIGLDYYYKPKTKRKLSLFKEKQKEVFLKQFNLAKELDLPVILHCRMAHQDLLSYLQEYKGVIHCFTGSSKEAEKYINLGYLIGLNGIIFKMDLDEVIKSLPLEKILVETDCPYLTPPQAPSGRNEPLFVKYVIEKIAELKGVSFEKVSEVTFKNAENLFHYGKIQSS